MKQRYYAAQDDIGMLQVVVTLGKPEALISVSNKKLDWHEVTLNKEQLEGLIKFLIEFPKE